MLSHIGLSPLVFLLVTVRIHSYYVPPPAYTPPPATCYLAQYDDQVGGEVASGHAVSTYKNLQYTSFNYASDSLALVGGLSFPSPHTAIFTSFQTQNGATPSLAPQDYRRLLRLRGVNFGCISPLQNGIVAKATECTIIVSGFDGNGEKAVASFTFTPPLFTLAKTPTVQANLPESFTDLFRATIVQTNPKGQVLVIDDLQFCLLPAPMSD